MERSKQEAVKIAQEITGITDYNQDTRRDQDCRIRQIAYFCIYDQGYSQSKVAKLFGRTQKTVFMGLNAIYFDDKEAINARDLFRKWVADRHDKLRRRPIQLPRNKAKWKATA